MTSGRLGDPDVTLVMMATQTARDTARRRVKQWRAGLIDCDALFAPCGWNAYKGSRPGQIKDPLVEEVMAATGLTESGAWHRIMKVRNGAWPKELLKASMQEVLAYTAQVKRGKRKIYAGGYGDWGDLGLGPRRSVASIPDGTAWERKHLGTT